MNNLLKEINQLRKNDVYTSDSLRRELLDYLLPKTVQDFTLDLSNVTSAFYGLMLDSVGETFGKEYIDEISKKTFYKLGKIKTQQCLEKMPELPRDARAFAIILISAIYNASPEYSFELKKYTPEHSIIELNGTDRYLRILTQLGINEEVTFPTLASFVEGVRDFLEIDFNISTKLLTKSNSITCTYEFNC